MPHVHIVNKDGVINMRGDYGCALEKLAKFIVWDSVPEESTLIIKDTRIPL